jgi:hypothetical protein
VDVLSNIQTNCRQTQNQSESHAYCAMGAWSALEGVSHGDEIYGAEMFKGMPPCQKKNKRTPVVGYRGIRISILPYLAYVLSDLYRSMFLLSLKRSPGGASSPMEFQLRSSDRRWRSSASATAKALAPAACHDGRGTPQMVITVIYFD